MAGHSKWKNIQHRKNRQDAKRGKTFAKLTRAIFVAARSGGGDPDTNQQLRLAISKARDANMPNDNIERTIKKATGELEGASYEEVVYEGYGPGGVAVLVDVLTDNRNRAAADIRHIFSKYGGSLGEAGCVAWMFERKGFLSVDRRKTSRDEDSVMLAALEAGAEDFTASDDAFDIVTSPEDFESVREALEAEGLPLLTAEITMIPKNTLQVSGETAPNLLKLLEALEDNDDVQNVYANFDLDEDQLASLANAE